MAVARNENDPNQYLLAPGHKACAGCGATIAVRQVLAVAGKETVACSCTGCLEVVSCSFPETAWQIPWIHVAFENVAAVAAGIEAALVAQGKKEGTNVIAFGGDGGTYDIGFQALSGMMERGHDILYVCYDNEAYMNTGIQRSGATPYWASTTTSPAGKVSLGEDRPKKPLAEICAAHRIPYVATASIGYPKDLERKVKKALSIKGPKFLEILTPCPTGWRHGSDITIEIAKLAVDTGIFQLWEEENGNRETRKVTIRPKERKPVGDYLKLQGRFRHIAKKPELVAQIQEAVDKECERFGID